MFFNLFGNIFNAFDQVVSQYHIADAQNDRPVADGLKQALNVRFKIRFIGTLF